MIKGLLSPPRLRTAGDDEAGDIRRATWTELFYDLVFVVAVSALSTRLKDDYSLSGILGFLGLFVPVWWAWVGHTIYAARFDTDDLIHRLAAAAMMLAAAAMAVQIPTALGEGSAGFAAAYVGARAVLLLLYLGVRLFVREARGITSLYLTGFSIGAGLWAVSIFVPPPLRFMLWAAGLAVDFVTPWLGRRRVLNQAPLHTSHLPERFGLFTIIVLGEAILGVVSSMSRMQWETGSILMAIFAFCVAVCVWWIYFAFIDDAPFVRNLGSGQPYIYSHLPIVVGVVLMGAGARQAILEAPRTALSGETIQLLGIGVVLWLVAFLMLLLVSVPNLPLRRTIGTCMGAVAATLLLAAFGAYLSPPLFLLGLVLVFVALVLVDIYSWRTGQSGGNPAGYEGVWKE